jgi:hypothetical protein
MEKANQRQENKNGRRKKTEASNNLNLGHPDQQRHQLRNLPEQEAHLRARRAACTRCGPPKLDDEFVKNRV